MKTATSPAPVAPTATKYIAPSAKILSDTSIKSAPSSIVLHRVFKSGSLELHSLASMLREKKRININVKYLYIIKKYYKLNVKSSF